MNINEATKVLALVSELWPSFIPTRDTPRAWQLILEEETAIDVFRAVKHLARNNPSSFAPTVSEVASVVKQIKSERPRPVYKALPSDDDSVCLEGYELNGRHYVRASRGARRAILEVYAKRRANRQW